MTLWDPKHRYANWLQQYDRGAMDGFDSETLDFGNGAPAHFAYSYVMQSDVQPYWDMAKSGALADQFFADHRSQSFSGHQYPIAGASGPITPELPNYYAADNPKHGQNCDTIGTGPAVNLTTGAEDKTYSTCFDYKTIADLIKAKGLSWRFYVDSPEATSSYISSFSVIKHIRNDPQQWKNVVSPAATVLDDAQNDKLPSVAYVIGAFADSDHAGQDVPSSNGPSWVASVVNTIGRGAAWNSTAVFLTYDDWGGLVRRGAASGPIQRVRGQVSGYRSWSSRHTRAAATSRTLRITGAACCTSAKRRSASAACSARTPAPTTCTTCSTSRKRRYRSFRSRLRRKSRRFSISAAPMMRRRLWTAIEVEANFMRSTVTIGRRAGDGRRIAS